MREYKKVNGEKAVAKSKVKKTGNGYIANIDLEIEFENKNYNFNSLYTFELEQEKKLIIKSLDKNLGILELLFNEIESVWQGKTEIFIQAISNNFGITDLESKSLLDDVIKTFELEISKINNSSELNKLKQLDIFFEV
jgi:hypothetical protein